MSSKNKKKKRFLTTNTGAPIADDMNSVTVGESGPTLLQDVQFLEKLGHFDRERIPERVVHATLVKLLLFSRSYLFYINFFLGPNRSISNT